MATVRTHTSRNRTVKPNRGFGKKRKASSTDHGALSGLHEALSGLVSEEGGQYNEEFARYNSRDQNIHVEKLIQVPANLRLLSAV